MRRGGFTLIELMIVVAIVGVLVTLAIPTFHQFQRRSKVAEALTNLDSIRKAELAYFSEFGTYLDSGGGVPAAVPGAARVAWPAASPFETLGWEPEGSVYCQYSVTADTGGGAGPALIRFTAEAASDVDGDGNLAFWAYVKPAPGAAVGLPGVLPGSTCAATGAYNASTMVQDLLQVVGPCSATAGRSVF